jgi:hypothetical protein
MLFGINSLMARGRPVNGQHLIQVGVVLPPEVLVSQVPQVLQELLERVQE